MSKYATKEQLISIVQDMASKISVPTIGIGGGYAPIGTVISYMGVTAPQDYLACDGSTYNISAYSDLADFFESQFGSKNYFGGDGVTTFGVPTLTGAPTNAIYCIKAVATGGGLNIDETGEEYEAGIYTDNQGNATPLYRKTFVTTTPANNTDTLIVELPSNCIARNFDGYILQDGYNRMPLNAYYTSSEFVCTYMQFNPSNGIRMKCESTQWRSCTAVITVLYTKTA